MSMFVSIKTKLVSLQKILAFCSFAAVANISWAAAGGLPEWGYTGSNGPEFWGELSTDGIHYPYATCSTGIKQSPIDLSNATRKEIGTLHTKYISWPLNVENNGHTIQVNYAPGSTMRINDHTYYLLQLHLHAASEHTVDGQHKPVEIHFVHMDSKGQLAVLGVFVKESHDTLENAQIAQIIAHAPHSVGKNAVSGNIIEAAQLIPAKNIKESWHYTGSLTTPPCSEGVKWYVSEKHIHASEEQISELESLLHHNYRPTQPLNQRILYQDK